MCLVRIITLMPNIKQQHIQQHFTGYLNYKFTSLLDGKLPLHLSNP